MALATNKYQIGNSATALNNFVIETPAVPDGSMTIRRGTLGATGDVVFSIDTSGNITGVLNDPRTRQVVTGSRTLGATYPNDTGWPIEVCARFNSASSGNAEAYINGVFSAGMTVLSNVAPCLTFTVAPGETYRISGSGASVTGPILWSELRV